MANGFKQNPQVKQSFDKYINIVFNKEGEIRGIFDAGINLFKKELGEYNAIPIEGIEVAKVALKEAYGDQALQTYLNVFNKMTQKLGMNTTASMTQMDPSLGLPTSFTEEQLADYNKVTGQDSEAPQTPSTETEPSQDGVVAEMRKKRRGVIIEGADYRGVYADANDDNIRFLKDGKTYVYGLYKLGSLMDIGVDVKNIKKEGEQILMDYSAYGQTGTEPLGKNKLDTIIPKIGQDKIEFLNAKQEKMYLKKQ